MEEKRQKSLSARDVLFAQEKWIKMTTVATTVIAVCTIAYFITTVLVLNQMKKDTNLQRNYYQNTIRPFLYFETNSGNISDNNKEFINFIKNVGALPAKNVRFAAIMDPKLLEEFKEMKEENSLISQKIVSDIFPNERAMIILKIPSNDLDKYFKEHPYFHFYMEFEDPGDNKYLYKAIYQIHDIQNDKIKIRTLWNSFQ